MIVNRFAEFVASAPTMRLAPAVAHAARRCVIDWFACAIPGGVVAPATLLAEALVAESVGGRAMLVPSGRKQSVRNAALINGAASHTLEFDDIYRDAVFHPGVVVIPPALAAAQGAQANGERFLRAVVAGYEVANRIGAAVTPAHYEYWHTTGTVGTFGAAAAAASVFGLDADQAADALANAGTFAAGLQQAFRSDSMSKPLHAGRAAETGVLVAKAAAKGVTGAHDILEGARGFAAAMVGEVDWEAALRDLGVDFSIVRTTQKNHSACGHSHAAIDGALELVQRHGIETGDIAAVRVGTYAKGLEVTANRDPKTAFEAKFSLTYCVAAGLLTGRVRLDAFTPERLRDAGLRALMNRIETYVDAEADARFPHGRGAVVEIETVDGKRVQGEALTRKGDPDNPLSDAEIEDKYRELVTPVIGAERAESLLALLWRIDGLEDVSALPFGEAQTKLAATAQ
ncbi:MAG: MmgE/PrpD family protein [Rhodospirillales bacterium]|nr:MmgE/PrpD family protein [Rhodospirillales bacterium]MDP6804554.1 MmgE/PrpD family protein [Rhodospirillales bacterium]